MVINFYVITIIGLVKNHLIVLPTFICAAGRK